MLIFNKKKKFDYSERKKNKNKKTSLADYFIIFRVRGVRIRDKRAQ